MGWWGYGVVEGDEPMDLLPDIRADIIGVTGDEHLEFETDEEYDKYEEQLDAKMTEKLKAGEYLHAIEHIQSGKHDRIGHRHIALQVLGEMIMVNGGVMSDETKAIIIEAAKGDEWALEGGEGSGRFEAMKAFIERVKSYEGVALEPTNRGLFDVINEAIAEGHKGLVNKK